MGKKKRPGRFTLQFSMEDPQQKMVSELLEQQGRHKAQYITSAILRYIQCPTSNDAPVIDRSMLEPVLLSILKEYPQFSAVSMDKPVNREETPVQVIPTIKTWARPMGDDAMRAISETLAAFQQGQE